MAQTVTDRNKESIYQAYKVRNDTSKVEMPEMIAFLYLDAEPEAEAFHLMVCPVDHRHLDGGNLSFALACARCDVGKGALATPRTIRQRSVGNGVEVLAHFAHEGKTLFAS